MQTICVIPARGGSKGLPNKNTMKLGGKALVARAVEDALQSGVMDVVLVTTDSEEIAAIAKKAGAEVPFLRPAEISGDLATTEETLKHALISYESLHNLSFETAVFLTATDVFRDVCQIREVVTRLHDNPDLESVFVGLKTHKNFWEEKSGGGYERLRSWMANYASRQVRRPIYREDTGLGCASRAWLWREGRRIGDKIDIVINEDDFSSIDIHVAEDLELARAALKIRQKEDMEGEL